MGTFRLADQCGNQLTRLTLPRQMGGSYFQKEKGSRKSCITLDPIRRSALSVPPT